MGRCWCSYLFRHRHCRLCHCRGRCWSVLTFSDLEAFSSTHSAIAHTCSRKYAEGFSLLRGGGVGGREVWGEHKREENGGKKFSVLKVLLSQFLCFCVCVIRERKTPGEWRTWKCLKSFETLGLLWEKCLTRNNFQHQNEFSLFVQTVSQPQNTIKSIFKKHQIHKN